MKSHRGHVHRYGLIISRSLVDSTTPHNNTSLRQINGLNAIPIHICDGSLNALSFKFVRSCPVSLSAAVSTLVWFLVHFTGPLNSIRLQSSMFPLHLCPWASPGKQCSFVRCRPSRRCSQTMCCYLNAMQETTIIVFIAPFLAQPFWHS